MSAILKRIEVREAHHGPTHALHTKGESSSITGVSKRETEGAQVKEDRQISESPLGAITFTDGAADEEKSVSVRAAG